jgi:hypothetical protein
MSELEVRIGKFTGTKYTVIAKHVTEDGEEFLWLKSGSDGAPVTATRRWVNDNTKPVFDFFEEKKSYYVRGVVYAIWHIQETAHGMAALAERADREPVVLTEDDWRAFKNYDGFK